MGNGFCGGSWNNGSNAGLGALNLNNAASNANSNIGARLATDDQPEAVAPKGARPELILRGRCPGLRAEDQQAAAASSHMANVAAPN